MTQLLVWGLGICHPVWSVPGSVVLAMNRKRFLLLTTVVAAATAGRWLFLDGSPSGKSPLEPEFLSNLFPHDQLVHLGRIYRTQYPGEGDAHALTARLLGDAGVDSLTSPEAAVARHLAARVGADFRAGRTVVVDGWVLSQTEARQCALLSLLA